VSAISSSAQIIVYGGMLFAHIQFQPNSMVEV
jgi:hypothetical protein